MKMNLFRSKIFEFNTYKIKSILRNFTYFRFLKIVVKTSFLSLLVFLGYRQIPFKSNFQFICSENKFNDYLINSILPMDYVPTFYMPNCLSQMIYNETKSIPEVKYDRQYIALDDEGVISLDWVINTNKNNPQSTASESNICHNKGSDSFDKDDKLLVILHGLTGGSEATYIREIILKFQKIKHLKIVVVNYRGISGSPLLTPLIYHAGFYQDLYEAMKFIKEKHPNLRCYALGTSMGANIFAKLLGNIHEFDDYIKGFIAISNPFNCLEVEKRNRSGILERFIIKRQIRYLENHKYILKDIFDFENLQKVQLHRHFDELITCKLFGFNTVEEYYEKSSSCFDLPNIRVPSIFINSLDDLLSPIDALDLEMCKIKYISIKCLFTFS